VDRGGDIVFGKLVLPWTQDCSGINTLIILLGVTLWANRSQPLGLSFLLRLILCIPAALIANVFRVLTLAAYRYVFFPEWESQQLHYFIGFFWMIPFLVLLVKDFRQKETIQWLEIFYMAVVLALLAPVVFSPGGSVVTICTLFYLAHNRIDDLNSKKIGLRYLLWGFSALLIGWSRMESLWLPWLLVCPRFFTPRLIYSWSGLIILSGTVSLLAMHTGWQLVVLSALGFQVYGFFQKKFRPAPDSSPLSLRMSELSLLVVLMTAPFILPGVIGINYNVERPPLGVMTKQLSFNSYKLRVAGQPSDIAVYWYGAYGDGRHHSLPACMRFRGVILKKNKQEKDIFLGDNKWMREFFIHDKELKSTYPEYLLASFSPFASPGVHIIFEARHDLISPVYFAQESERIVKQLHQIYKKTF
jgi:exosortase/archaeosortase family protein